MPSHEVPRTIPVFPLTGSLLLPGNFLPLNVFEPRYRHLVEDVGKGGVFGMIQPVEPGPDNWGIPRDPPVPELYDVGCLGLMESCDPQSDGRFLVLLRGILRFRIVQELPLHRGYRRVEVDYEEFLPDLDEPSIDLEAAPMLAGVRRYAQERQLEIDQDILVSLTGIQLLNALCAALPFSPSEKQLLLETRAPRERQRILLELMGMDALEGGGEGFGAPVVN